MNQPLFTVVSCYHTTTHATLLDTYQQIPIVKDQIKRDGWNEIIPHIHLPSYLGIDRRRRRLDQIRWLLLS